MGWLFKYGATRSDLIRELSDKSVVQLRPNGGTFATLRRCTRGNVLWALHESIDPDGVSTRFIACYLLQRSAEGWGYKDMDESMGPYYYTCPISYLDEASEPISETARKWREEVRRVDRQRKSGGGDETAHIRAAQA